MRLTLALILAGLLLVPTALADSGGHAKARSARAAEDDHGHHNEDEKKELRHNETRWDAWHARVKALFASWHENASAIRERCHAVEKPDNATREQRQAWAHCVRDGYKSFFDHLRADLKQARLARSH